MGNTCKPMAVSFQCMTKFTTNKKKIKKKSTNGSSLVIQWLRIRLAMQRTGVQSLVRELRSHMPWSN